MLHVTNKPEKKSETGNTTDCSGCLRGRQVLFIVADLFPLATVENKTVTGQTNKLQFKSTVNLDFVSLSLFSNLALMVFHKSHVICSWLHQL